MLRHSNYLNVAARLSAIIEDAIVGFLFLSIVIKISKNINSLLLAFSLLKKKEDISIFMQLLGKNSRILITASVLNIKLNVRTRTFNKDEIIDSLENSVPT